MNNIPERNFIIEASKITGFKKENVIKLSISELNWLEVLRIASKNKVLLLIYNNVINLCGSQYLPKQLIPILSDASSCNYLRNQRKLQELSLISKAMSEKGILFAPVKGGYLIDNVYGNRCVRATNDMDVLIKRNDIKIINEIMESLGYIQGDYNIEKNEVILPDKNKRLLYKTKMYNLLPYIKISNDIPNTTVIFDLSFALDFTLDTKPVEEMLVHALQTDNGLELLPEHFFIHMCCHHYREASNVAWILIGKDLNLIKFCDVREFILKKMNSNAITKAVQFAKKHGLEKAVYFTIYFTREIYNDGYETEILESLDIEDETFLYQFGEKDYDELQTRKKDFWTSLFSDDNKDEIVQDPKYKSLI